MPRPFITSVVAKLTVRVSAMTNNDRPAEASDEVGTGPATPSMGTLVIQTWHEADLTSRFRSRVTYGKQEDGEASTRYFSDPVDVLNAVREWLIGTTDQAPQV